MGSMTEFRLPWPETGLRRGPAVSLSPRVYYSPKSAPSVHSRLQVSESGRRPVLVLHSLLGISFNNGKGTCAMPLLFSHIRIKTRTQWGWQAMTIYRSLFFCLSQGVRKEKKGRVICRRQIMKKLDLWLRDSLLVSKVFVSVLHPLVRCNDSIQKETARFLLHWLQGAD